jgi:hypothetical protein
MVNGAGCEWDRRVRHQQVFPHGGSPTELVEPCGALPRKCLFCLFCCVRFRRDSTSIDFIGRAVIGSRAAAWRTSRMDPPGTSAVGALAISKVSRKTFPASLSASSLQAGETTRASSPSTYFILITKSLSHQIGCCLIAGVWASSNSIAFWLRSAM